MRAAGSQVFAGVVLALALLSSTVFPLAAFAVPMLLVDVADPDSAREPAAARSAEREAAAADVAVGAEESLLEDAGADYSQLLGLGRSSTSGVAGGVDQPSVLTIPEVVLAAYRNAARNASAVVEGCTLDWPVLAGIGRVESRHGLFLGDDSVIDTQGNIGQHIVGPALDGDGLASISDSDRGRLDGDSDWDRAVGLMQFIPSSWQRYGQDGNDDGKRDPHNVFDATLAATDHLCSTHPGDLADDTRLDRALFSYNRSTRYVSDVRRWIDIYRSADPADVASTGTAQQVADARRNPFSGQLSTLAFDGEVPGAPRSPAAAPRPATTAAPPAAPAQKSTAKPAEPTPEPSEPKKPKPTPTPSPTPSPTPTPSPSPTPTPTPTPEPTPEPSPTPTPLSTPASDPSTAPEPSESPSP
ncbi:hypothetical protein BH23ACT10_BH23ACT10_37390 [soil metagenome]